MTNNVIAVLKAILKIIVLFGTGSMMVMGCLIIVMTILKQVFGISTKNMVYGWLRRQDNDGLG